MFSQKSSIGGFRLGNFFPDGLKVKLMIFFIVVVIIYITIIIIIIIIITIIIIIFSNFSYHYLTEVYL